MGLPGMNGIEVTRLLKKQHRAPDAMILASSNDETVGAAIEVGASGYILKSCNRQQLVPAVWAVNHGQASIDPTRTRRLVRELVELRKAHQGSLQTPRQVEIPKLAANGSRFKEITATRNSQRLQPAGRQRCDTRCVPGIQEGPYLAQHRRHLPPATALIPSGWRL